MDILYSITQVKEQDGTYEIHPCNHDIVSGIIKSENGTLTDKETGEVYTEEDIWDIQSFEEEHSVYYKRLI